MFLIHLLIISFEITEVINDVDSVIEVKIMSYVVDEILLQNHDFITRDQTSDSFSL
jgi:hypothetical protein